MNLANLLETWGDSNVLAIAGALVGFTFGLAYSIFPDIVIGRMTVWEAAISTASLNVIFVGVAITLPVIIAYTVFMYRVFWGKATALKYG